MRGLAGGERPGDSAQEADATGPFKGGDPTDYYTAGSVAITFAALGLIVLPVCLAGYRERGGVRRFQASAMLFVALGLGTLVVAVVGTALMLVLRFPAYGANCPDSIGAVAVGFALGLLSHVALGVLLPTARAAQGAGLSLFFVMVFISGAAPPRDVMPGYMVTFGEVLPLTHVVTTLQDPWLAYASQVEVWNGVALTITAGVLAAAPPASGLVLRCT